MGVTLVAVLTLLGAWLGMTGAQGVHSPVLGAATQLRRDYTVHSHDKQVNTSNFGFNKLVLIN